MEILDFLNNGRLDVCLNETEVVLVSKMTEVRRVDDLRPIILCNVSMKIITKVLANRLCRILPMLISGTQSAFVKGRVITDNVIVAHEVSHYIWKRKHGFNGFL